MIDTVRFKVPTGYELWANVEPSCVKITTETDIAELMKDPKLSGSIIIPPHDQPLIVLGYKYNIYLESSLPRLQYGANTRLLYPHQVPDLLKRIHQALLDKYKDFPSWETWEVQRADFCYAWKFSSEEEALRVLEFFMYLEYPRKHIDIYPKESISFRGRSVQIKLYLKDPEFTKKYHELFKKGLYDLADEAAKYSENALRFEVELKKSALKTLYDKPTITYKDLIDEAICLKVLNKALDTLLRNSNRKSINDEEAIKTLIEKYGHQKGIKLFHRYKVFYLKEKHIKRLLNKYINRTTTLRDLKEISNASVGVPNDNKPLLFDISIPGKNVVNFEPAPPALAGEAVNKTIQVAEEIDDKKTKQLDFDKLLEKF